MKPQKGQFEDPDEHEEDEDIEKGEDDEPEAILKNSDIKNQEMTPTEGFINQIATGNINTPAKGARNVDEMFPTKAERDARGPLPPNKDFSTKKEGKKASQKKYNDKIAAQKQGRKTGKPATSKAIAGVVVSTKDLDEEMRGFFNSGTLDKPSELCNSGCTAGDLSKWNTCATHTRLFNELQ
jgi:hypothetical protein